MSPMTAPFLDPLAELVDIGAAPAPSAPRERDPETAWLEGDSDIRPPETRSVTPQMLAPFGPLPDANTRGSDGRRFKTWWNDLLDDLMLHPTATAAERGARLGRGAQSIGYVLNSDMFRASYAKRRQEHSARISDAIIDTSQRVAHKALTQIEKVIDNDVHGKINPIALKEIAETALNTIGLGAKPGPAVQINTYSQTNNVVSHDDLLAAKRRIADREAAATAAAAERPRPLVITQHLNTPSAPSAVDRDNQRHGDADVSEGAQAPEPRGSGGN